MYANHDGCRIVDSYGNQLRVYINGSHICVSTFDRREVLFKRDDPSKADWYDDSHQKVVEAIAALELAMRSAIGGS